MPHDTNVSAHALVQALTAIVDPTKKKADWSSIDVPVEHAGRKIVLPDDPAEMGYSEAISILQRVQEQENVVFDVSQIVRGAPWDAMVAVYRAMQDLYGVVLVNGWKTFFGEIPPDMVNVRTGPGERDVIQVPVGQMTLPGMREPIGLAMGPHGCTIHGKCRKPERALILELAARAQRFLHEQSIYKGRAIRLGVDDAGALNLRTQPEFLDLTKVQEADMIHTAETDGMIRVNIFGPLKHTEACRKNRIPLKRGILLEGRYGTGKSLTARVTAKVATDNAWTFIVLDRAQGLKTAIEFAKNYQPCVIFAEDIDRAGADRDNDESVNDLVNLIDGILTKDAEIMCVLTTNHVDRIDRALLRPGRFDAVISIQAPDADAVKRLIRHYARDLLDSAITLNEAAVTLEGQIPATVREVVERAKLGMLTEGRTALSEDDLTIAAKGMARHLALLNPPEENDTPAERLYAALVGLVQRASGIEESAIDTIHDTKDLLDSVSDRAERIENTIDEHAGQTSRNLRAIGDTTTRTAKKVGAVA